MRVPAQPQRKLITCILPHGVALDVLERLKQDRGIIEASANSARGMGKLTPLAHRGVGGETEKDILNVLTTADNADELFEYLYDVARINRPHGGIIFMTPLGRSTPFVLPELQELSGPRIDDEGGDPVPR